MEEFSEKQGENIQSDDETHEFSTVFSAPVEHTGEKLKSPKRRRVIAVVSAVLAVCVLVGGTLAIIKFIPKKDDDASNTSDINTLTVVDFDKAKFDMVTVNNENGEFVFYPEDETESSDSSGDPVIKWYLKDIAKDKVSASKIDTIISSAAKITANMEITQKTYEECGFNDSGLKIQVKSNELGDFSIVFGDVSPDNFGEYLYSSIDEKIYLVPNDTSNDFIFTPLDLASTDSVAPISISDESKKYVDDSGNLISFDKLEISGSKYMYPVVITPLPDDDQSIGFAYKVVSPVSRYAESDSVSSVLGAFSSGISVSGVYSFDTDAGSLARFGLNNPDVVLKMTVSGKSFTYKFAEQEDGFYALFGDGMNTVKKISSSAAGFLSYGETNYYNKLVYIKSISEVKNMTFDFDGQNYSFDISENGEDDDEKYNVNYAGKRIKSQYFQNFYMHFVGITLVDFSAIKGTDSPDMTAKITDNVGSVQTLSFYKASATEYYCSIDNAPIGKITATTYNKLVNDIKTVSENKDVAN